ncbi:hypothetical protein KR059_006528, partial [Drosophila kikkawai]
IGNTNYFISPVKTNFFAARDLCMQRDGDMAAFESSADLEAVLDYLINNEDKLNGEHKFWTSYFDLGRPTGMFYSIATGMPLTSSGWQPGEPNNSRNDEHCVHIWNYNKKYGLNDVNCMSTFRALCKKNTQLNVSPF